jgi:aliphatic nitrilase
MHVPLAETVEGIVYADLDLGMISLAKTAADPAGHSARPDVTRLLLDKTPADPVVFSSRQGRVISRAAGEEEPLLIARSEVPAAPVSATRKST